MRTHLIWLALVFAFACSNESPTRGTDALSESFPQAGTRYHLFNPTRGGYLDVRNDGELQIVAAPSGASSEFRFVATAEGDYQIVSERSDRGVLDTEPDHQIVANPSAAPNAADKRWRIRTYNAGQYGFVNQFEGRGALSIRNGRGWWKRGEGTSGTSTVWVPQAVSAPEPLDSGPGDSGRGDSGPGDSGNGDSGDGGFDGGFDAGEDDLSPGGLAKARVLAFLNESMGTHLLVGQHDYSGSFGQYRQRERDTGDYPAIWGSDWAYGTNATPERWQRNVDHAIDAWNAGSLVTFTWHMVYPGLPNSAGWDGVRYGKRTVTLEDHRAMVTPGTTLNRQFNERLDSVVPYLRQLQDAGVPVIFRPFHELNLRGFWWCRRGVRELWRYTHDRFTDLHGLDHLIWNWNFNYTDRNEFSADPTPFFPGLDTIDMISVDDYTAKDSRARGAEVPRTPDYELMQRLAPGYPMALGEIPMPPRGSFVRDHRPEVVYYLMWPDSDPTVLDARTTRDDYRNSYRESYTITQREMPDLR